MQLMRFAFALTVLATAQAGAQVGGDWGIYGELEGTSRQAPNGFRLEWRREGATLYERWINPNGKVKATTAITRDASTGHLKLDGSYFGRHTWDGVIGPDGSVVWTVEAKPKLGYTVRPGANCAVDVAMSGGSIRYLPVEGACPVAGRSVAGSAAAQPPGVTSGADAASASRARGTPPTALAAVPHSQPTSSAIAAEAGPEAPAGAPGVDRPIVYLKPGATVEQKRGGKIDFYRLVGVPGTKARVVVSLTGSAVVTLYTPEGDVVLRREGSRSVPVQAILSSAGIYAVSVVRPKASSPYKIALTTKDPSWVFASMAQSVGYLAHVNGRAQYQCWVEPGRVVKTVSNTMTRTMTLQDADHAASVQSDLKRNYVTTAAASEGVPMLHRRWADTGEEFGAFPLRIDWSPASDPQMEIHWFAYLCSDADARMQKGDIR